MSNKKWSPKNVQPAAGKVVWDQFDAEAARDGAAINQAKQMRVKRPRRAK